MMLDGQEKKVSLSSLIGAQPQNFYEWLKKGYKCYLVSAVGCDNVENEG